MRVRVYAPSFASFEHLDEKGYMELEEGATLREVFKRLKMPFAFGAVLFFRVNYEKASLDQKLKEGDVISFYSPLAGG